MGYYTGKLTYIIEEVAGEIENGLEEISDNLKFLEGLDWSEIFENVEDSDSLQSDIESCIGDIRYALDNIND